MRVLHVINSLRGGGAEKMLCELLPELAVRGIQLGLLTIRPLDLDNDLQRELAEVSELYALDSDNVYSPQAMFRLIPYTREYDIVHAHLFPSQYFVALAKILSNKLQPAVTTEHNTHNRRRDHRLLRGIEKRVYSQYNRIICISRAAEENLARWLPGITDKTITIPNGIELQRFTEAKPIPLEKLSLSLKQYRYFILMVARMTEQKDHRTVIEAISKLPEDCCLLLAGDGPLMQEHIAYSRELDVTDRVFFLGLQRNIERIMKSVDVCVVSSHWEGFGLVVVEAMASGVPVVASNVPGLSEVVGQAGCLFPVGDAESLASILLGLFDNNERCSHYVELGQARAREYSIQLTAERYIQVYQNILCSHN